MKKSQLILLLIVLGVLMSSFALAGPINNAISRILDIGSLKWLLGGSADNQFIGFIRIAVGVLVFSLLYMGMSLIPGMNRNISITVAAILAIITAVFLPGSVLTLFGETYSTIFALLIIGAPIVGVLWLLFGTPTPNRGWATVKFLVVCFVIWLINEISHWAGLLAAGTGRWP